MKLLIATDNFEPRLDGIARFLSVIIPDLAKSYEITVLAPDFPGKKTKHPGVTVKRFPVSSFSVGDFTPAKLSFSLIRGIQKAVRNTDMVWTNTIGPIGLLTLRTADKYRKPLASFVHSIEWSLVRMSMARHNLLRRPAKSLARVVARSHYNHCDRLMVPSLEVLETLDFNRIHTPKVVIPLGTDTERFFPAKSKVTAKEAIGLNPKKKVIGYCGRIAREKDIRTLLRAFIRLKAKRDDVMLLLVGEGVRDFDRVIKAHKDIVAVGQQADVVPYLQAMDVYVLPSLIETSSLSTMEAMACGVPVICTPVGLVRNYVKEKENGLFFRKGNSVVLSIKLNWLLSQTSVMRKLGENARDTIVKRASWERTTEKISEVLSSLRVD